ncbi:NETR protein, partial [Crypturellus undulatus]|nr:NETR protein [Crypturellus undulatus]
QGSGPILLDEVECSGNELSLDQCRKSDWGQQNCDHIEDAGVSCDPFTGPPVRLVDGESTKEGRVEVFLNGQWGSVCDEGWTDRDAAVVCRQLGFSGAAKARGMAYFGEGHGPIHLDNIECSGMEHALGECGRPDTGTHSCWHNEDAGVICDYVEEKIPDIRKAGDLPTSCVLKS